MARTGLVLGLTLALAGCASSTQERVNTYRQAGYQEYQVGNYRDARQSYEAALTLEPNDVGLLYNVASCHDRLGSDAQAENYYVECLRRSPNHATCRHALAVLWVREGKGDQAVRMIEDWLAAQPKLADAYAEEGWLRHQMGDLNGAQSRLQQALQIDPQNTRAQVELALIYEEKHRPDLATVLYERCLRIDPNQPDVTRRLAALRNAANAASSAPSAPGA